MLIPDTWLIMLVASFLRNQTSYHISISEEELRVLYPEVVLK